MTEDTKNAARTISPEHKDQINSIVCNLGDVGEVLKGLRASMDFSDRTEEQRSMQATLTLSLRALETEIRRPETLARFVLSGDRRMQPFASLEPAVQ